MIYDEMQNEQPEPEKEPEAVEKPLEFEPDVDSFPDGFKGYPPVVDGVRDVTQDPKFDPTMDKEEDYA